MKDRVVYHVVYERGLNRWLVRVIRRNIASLVFSSHMFKFMAVWAARTEAEINWRENMQPTQVMVHKKNGKFQIEYTYGNDPRESVG